MEKVGQQMEAKQRLIGAAHHSEPTSKDSGSMVALLTTPTVTLLTCGGIKRNFGN